MPVHLTTTLLSPGQPHDPTALGSATASVTLAGLPQKDSSDI